jgi:pimeloyl-ACP methyl ester carboxylesterase
MLLRVDGREVFAATGGRPFDPGKPVIVFLHGAGGDRTVWMQPARSFAQRGWSVLAPDLPGHGRSQGPALGSIEALVSWTLHVLDAAGAPRAAIVGHSMGGAVALECAARAPERITRVALVGTAAAIPVNPALIETARHDPGSAYDMMTTWALAPAARVGTSPTPGTYLYGAVRSVFGTCAAGSLATDLEACRDWTSGPSAAARVGCPADVIVAELDVMTPAKRGRELAGLLSASRLTVIPKTGHMIPQEAPDALIAALRAGFGRQAA